MTGARDGAGLYWIRFDDPDRKVNILTDAAMRALEAALSAAEDAADLVGVVFASGKPDVFLAGADISIFDRIRTAAEGEALARAGQAIFDRVARLPVPSVALVSGACLGGGLELALACDWIVAAETPRTRLGLPEVQLGIIPGLGGTQRLPARVGPATALDLILTGRTVDARRARSVGLVDETCPPEILSARAAVWAARGKRRRRRAWTDVLWRTPLRTIPLTAARRAIRAKTRGRYPAPPAAIEAIETGLARGRRAGLAREAALFGTLAVGPVSRNLVRLFFLKEKFSKPLEGADATPAFRKAGVVGAGIMGGGIAHLLAASGLRVRIKDIAPEPLAKALAVARDLDKRLARAGREGRLRAEQNRQRILPTLDDTGFADADVVIEAVVENLALKQKVFAGLERCAGPRTILATNTSSLPISRIAASLERPERAVGIHFFNPVHKMPLVEVIPGERTDRETVARAVAFVLAVGKIPIVAADRPGFLVNRILLPYVAEAVRCWADGAGTRAVDEALLDFGMPMGPLALADAVGIDVGAKVAHVLEEAYGARMAVPAVMRAMEERRWLGVKSGRGFYVYRNDRAEAPNADLAALAPRGARPPPAAAEIVDRCVLTMVNEAARCLAEKIVDSPDALDAAMVFGTGFAPFRGGLWRYATERGLADCRARLQELAGRLGERFAPADALGAP